MTAPELSDSNSDSDSDSDSDNDSSSDGEGNPFPRCKRSYQQIREHTSSGDAPQRDTPPCPHSINAPDATTSTLAQSSNPTVDTVQSDSHGCLLTPFTNAGYL